MQFELDGQGALDVTSDSAVVTVFEFKSSLAGSHYNHIARMHALVGSGCAKEVDIMAPAQAFTCKSCIWAAEHLSPGGAMACKRTRRAFCSEAASRVLCFCVRVLLPGLDVTFWVELEATQ